MGIEEVTKLCGKCFEIEGKSIPELNHKCLYNDINKLIDNRIREFVNKLKEELHWTNIKDGSGAWSPGQVNHKIDEVLKTKGLK